MRFLEFRIARRYLAKLPKALLITVAAVFIVAQTLILLATSLPFDPSQRADRLVGARQYAFITGGQGASALDTSESVAKALELQQQGYSESLYGELYLSGIALKTTFGDGQVEWQKSIENIDYSSKDLDGFLYTESTNSKKLIVTSIIGSNEKNNLRLLEVPGQYNRLVLKPGTYRAQKWNSQGILPGASLNLNFDSTLNQEVLVQKISTLFADGSFAPAQEPSGCMAANCLIDRDYIIAEGRGDYLRNLVTPYLLSILLVLLPILIRGGKELRLESNKLSELGIKRFERPKSSTFRLLAALVLIVNLFSFLGIGVGWAVYLVFKSQAPADFGSVLVPVDLMLGGLLWSVMAAGAVALTGETKTQTFTSKSALKNLVTTKWVLVILALLSSWNVLTLSADATIFAPWVSAELQWEASAAVGILVLTLISLISLRVRDKSKQKLFQVLLVRKYPLMSLIMIVSLFVTSLLSGIALPALALSDRYSAATASVTYPEGNFSIPTGGGYPDALRNKAKKISDFKVPNQTDIINSNIPFASGSGSFLVFPKDAAAQLWPNLKQEPKLERGQLFLFVISVDKARTTPEVVSFQSGDKTTEYLSHFLKADDAWGSSYTGVFIDTVPEAFAKIFTGEESLVLMQTDLEVNSINAVLLDAGLDPGKASFWYSPGEGQLKYRLALYLVFSFLLGLMLSFFVVRAVNATFKREASLIKALGYSSKEIQTILRGMLLKNFGIAMSLGIAGLAFYFVRSNASVDVLPEEIFMGIGAFLFASLTGLIPILFAGRIRLQVEEDVR